MNVCLRVALAGALGCAASRAQATDYYVATTGDDAHAGTEAAPWRTIHKAAQYMVAGDRVFIRGGVYSAKILPQNSGEPGKPIVYQGYPGEEVIIRSTDTSAAGYGIGLSSSRELRHLHFRNLTLRGAGGVNFYAAASPEAKSHLLLEGLRVDSGYLGIYFQLGVTHSDIRHCEVHYNQYNIYLDRLNEHIRVDSNHVSHAQRYRSEGTLFASNIEAHGDPGAKNRYVVISHNHVHHAHTQGITVIHTDDAIVRGNHSHHNGATGIQVESIDDPDLTRRVLVEGNLCEYNSQIYGTETGIWVDDSDSVIVQHNIMRFNEHGLRLTGSNHVIVRFNTMYENNHDTFIGATGLYVNTSQQRDVADGDIVVHNTLYRNGGNSQRAQVTFGVSGSVAPVTRAVFKNNIASEAQSDFDYWVYGTTHHMDYNAFYRSAGALDVVWNSFLMPWETYRAQSGLDAHSLVIDPQFADAASGDFALADTSPCVDAGAALTRTTGPGSGFTLPVADARYFTDGMGLVPGDVIQLESGDTARVNAVDYAAGTLTLSRALSWASGEGVSYPHLGSMPDLGAWEFDPTLAGDVNGDAVITSADIIYLVNYVFKGGPGPVNQSGDLDCSGSTTSGDIIVLVNFVFRGGAPPCPEAV